MPADEAVSIINACATCGGSYFLIHRRNVLVMHCKGYQALIYSSPPHISPVHQAFLDVHRESKKHSEQKPSPTVLSQWCQQHVKLAKPLESTSALGNLLLWLVNNAVVYCGKRRKIWTILLHGEYMSILLLPSSFFFVDSLSCLFSQMNVHDRVTARFSGNYPS